MKYPLVAYSWTAMSPNTVFKRMDKSTFIHRGTSIPKQLSGFFKIPDGDMLSSLNIQFHLDGKTYNARIEMDVLHSRYRLFWLSDFTQEIKRRFPDHYDIFKNGQGIGEDSCPTMRFDRIGDDTYSVSWEVPDVDSLPTHDESTLNQRVTRLLKRGITGKPKGHHFPSAKTSSHSVYYRDPMVKAWVLDNAKGTCELCGDLGPFIDKTGHYFLEEHHVIPLADGGSDTVENAVALCPNCHRKCHLGQDTESTRMELLDKVDRIISIASMN